MNGDRWVNLPPHLRTVPDNRKATAPYNFVPLPETVVRAYEDASELPSHARYDPKRKTGWIDVTLKTKSPLFIRSAPTTEQYRQTIGEEPQNFREQVKNRPEFFHHGDPARPIIPGSSLRGMLRGVLEIVSYGKVERVTNKSFFYRTVERSSLADWYREKMIDDLPDHNDLPVYESIPEAGLIDRHGQQWFIKPSAFARVEQADVAAAFGISVNQLWQRAGGRMRVPAWAVNERQVQHATVYCKLAPDDLHRHPANGRHPDMYLAYRKVARLVLAAAATEEEQTTLHRGTLVLTGEVPHRHMAFVVFDPDPEAEPVPVPPEVIDRYHHPDQLTQWQERAFPKDKPRAGCRPHAGYLRPGDPVFFISNEDDTGQEFVWFLGRPQMFRLPYDTTPRKLIPCTVRHEPDLDYADALFGWVKGQGKQGSRDRSFAGRVCVGDAVPVGEVEFLDTLVPRILATPKPTAFQKYLTQLSDEPRRLQHYDSGAQDGQAPVIRGHKRYWSQGAVTPGQIREQDPNWLGPDGEVKSDSTQHTQMTPVAAGATFTFRIWFENLDQRELGALCWALCPVGDENVTYVHQLGMGKPLGLGAVEVTKAEVHLTQRPQRYESLFEGEGWAIGGKILGDLCDEETLNDLTGEFEEHVLTELGQQDKLEWLSDLPRLQALLALMTWRDPGNICVDDDGLARERKVLPGVWQLAGTAYPTPLTRPVPPAPAPAAAPAPTTHQPAPTPRKPAPPPAAKAPEPARPALKAGKQNLEVVAVEGRMVTLRLPDGTTFARKWDRYGDPPAVGDPVKVKLRLSTDGTRVEKLEWD